MFFTSSPIQVMLPLAIYYVIPISALLLFLFYLALNGTLFSIINSKLKSKIKDIRVVLVTLLCTLTNAGSLFALAFLLPNASFFHSFIIASIMTGINIYLNIYRQMMDIDVRARFTVSLIFLLINLPYLYLLD